MFCIPEAIEIRKLLEKLDANKSQDDNALIKTYLETVNDLSTVIEGAVKNQFEQNHDFNADDIK